MSVFPNTLAALEALENLVDGLSPATELDLPIDGQCEHILAGGGDVKVDRSRAPIAPPPRFGIGGFVTRFWARVKGVVSI